MPFNKTGTILFVYLNEVNRRNRRELGVPSKRRNSRISDAISSLAN